MDRRRRSKQPRRAPSRTVRRLWLAAAAALVITYAVLLRRASLSTEPPAEKAAERAALFDAARTSMPPPAQALGDDKEEGGKQLRVVGNELLSGLLNAANQRDGDAAKAMLRVEADDTEAQTDLPRTSDAAEEGAAITAATVQSDTQPDTTKPASEAEPKVPVEAAVPGEDALQPVHEFTGADALPVKADATDKPADSHLFTDASYFDSLLAASRQEKVTEEEAHPTHQFTDASYFDNLAREGNAQGDDEQAHLFTDASYFDSLAAVEPTDKVETHASHQFTDASFFDNLGVAPAEEEEQEELPPVKVSRFDDSRLVQYVESSSQAVPMEQRHDFIAGYDATIEYLQNYKTPEGSNEQLFLFFVCSDANGTALDWKPICADAKKTVYDIFAKSPSTNRLVTIYAGPEEVWQGPNMLKENDDLRLKSIPSIMRWDGGAPDAKRSTYGMMIDETVLSEPFLRYLFRNTDRVDERLAQPDVKTKEIVTVKGYEQYSRFIDSYKQNGESYPLFMILMSGRWKSNNRLWCPFSRQSELPLEYAFYAFAPRDARFLIVETYDLYKEWKNPDNEFKKDPTLSPKGVPWFFRVYPEAGGALLFQRVKQRFYMLDSLRLVFEDSA